MTIQPLALPSLGCCYWTCLGPNNWRMSHWGGVQAPWLNSVAGQSFVRFQKPLWNWLPPTGWAVQRPWTHSPTDWSQAGSTAAQRRNSQSCLPSLFSLKILRVWRGGGLIIFQDSFSVGVCGVFPWWVPLVCLSPRYHPSGTELPWPQNGSSGSS